MFNSTKTSENAFESLTKDYVTKNFKKESSAAEQIEPKYLAEAGDLISFDEEPSSRTTPGTEACHTPGTEACHTPGNNDTMNFFSRGFSPKEATKKEFEKISAETDAFLSKIK